MTFIKGQKAWNSGIKIDKEKYPNIGHRKPHSEEAKKKMSEALKGHSPNKTSFKKKENTGSTNYKWKGDDVSYSALHKWVKYHKGDPKTCINCGKEGNNRQIHWANIDHKYKRNLEDWKPFCVKCHKQHDKLLK